MFAEAEKLGLEGIVSKHRDSHYRSGRTDRWRKVKCWTKSELVVVGTAVDKKTGGPIALLAEDARHLRGPGALRHATVETLQD